MISRTISIPELIWTIFAIIGFVYNLRVTWRSAIDLLTIRVHRINGIRRYAALTTIQLFGVFVVVQMAFIAIGALAMVTPNHHNNDSSFAVQYALLVILVGVSVLLAVSAYRTDCRRRELARKIAKIEGGME